MVWVSVRVAKVELLTLTYMIFYCSFALRALTDTVLPHREESYVSLETYCPTRIPGEVF
jgi:hypothetical protein